MIQSGTKLPKKKNVHDVRRIIRQTYFTDEEEIAQKESLSLDLTVIENKAKYDGFYVVCTNLDVSVETIVKVNHRRWEIEETFRIIKIEFDFHGDFDFLCIVSIFSA